jgi:CYTH domain-containing protein
MLDAGYFSRTSDITYQTYKEMTQNHKEIERKFLIRKDFWYAILKPEGEDLIQGYLVSEPGKTIRVRVSPSSGYLTIKGPSENATRDEYEYPIPRQDAIELLDKFAASRIDKVRYRITYQGKTWEVDEFFGLNEGLISAEIELSTPKEEYEIPNWIGEEVTEDHRYANSWLAEHPFTQWEL